MLSRSKLFLSVGDSVHLGFHVSLPVISRALPYLCPVTCIIFTFGAKWQVEQAGSGGNASDSYSRGIRLAVM
jgi:hypothetical protein